MDLDPAEPKQKNPISPLKKKNNMDPKSFKDLDFRVKSHQSTRSPGNRLKFFVPNDYEKKFFRNGEYGCKKGSYSSRYIHLVQWNR